MRVLGSAVAACVLLSTGAALATHEAHTPQPYDQTVPVQVPAPPPPEATEFKLSWGGFIKLDALYSMFSDGDVPSLDNGRDHFRPGAIPVATPPAAEEASEFLDFHAKDTRFFFKADGQHGGRKLGGTIELDFRSTPGGASERVTNAFNPRLRRAWINYGDWTAGQDWTTFRNSDAIPEHIDDLAGPVEAITIVRQPLVRYAWPALGVQVALENPETDLLPFGGTTAGTTPVTAPFLAGDARLPDVVARYDLKTGFGAFSVGALVRELRADNQATGGDAPNDRADGTATAYALNAAGKIPFGDSDLRFTLTGGDGVGRYVALATVPDAVVDGAGGLEPIPVIAAHVSWRQPWSALWRSNFTVAGLQADNDAALTGDRATAAVYSAHANLLYTPWEKLLIGVEYTHAIREIENGEEGTLNRLQCSAKYLF